MSVLFVVVVHVVTVGITALVCVSPDNTTLPFVADAVVTTVIDVGMQPVFLAINRNDV
jgi:hypothetical protein